MSINSLESVEFDRPFAVDTGGVVTWADGYHAPSVYGSDGEVDIDSDQWEFFSTGYTGQYGYNGPVMHDSEFLGGRLARDILETPGVYVLCPVYWEDDSEGWVVLRHISSH